MLAEHKTESKILNFYNPILVTDYAIGLLNEVECENEILRKQNFWHVTTQTYLLIMFST